MSALFGRLKKKGKTVLIVDVENGSVGSALACLSQEGPPRLFGEKRLHVPLPHMLDAHALARETSTAVRTVLLHAGEVAARLRLHPPLSVLGEIDHTAVFLHAPWSTVSFEESGMAAPAAIENFLEGVRELHTVSVGEIPVSFHSFGTSAAPLLSRIYGISERTLSCIVGGEVTELFLSEGGTIVGHATIPFGVNTLLRTLKIHGGLSEAEARSVLHLRGLHAEESLNSTFADFTQEFADTARELLRRAPIRHVFLVGHEPYAEWFARSLASERLGDVFAEGGSVRTVRGIHIAPYITAHARISDTKLMLGALFADTRFGGV